MPVRIGKWWKRPRPAKSPSSIPASRATPPSPVWTSFCNEPSPSGKARSQARGDPADVARVAALAQCRQPRLHRVDGHVAQAQRDLLRAADLETLAAFQRRDELGGLEQRIHRAGIEPRVAAS